ncbi:Hypothetical protein CINCED_3A016424 [Cinara cedri]|uniref:Uncharacterized protein n=1 Tax=Cinara cedri TaxID=506608 RepID=A0A5E4MB12_9HEMI|nr:Hypothetical protein CINCED_3A016424 [Cinara cedri]
MRGFKLYAIIVVILCLTLQEASCKKSKPIPKTVSDSDVEDKMYEDLKSVQQSVSEEEETGVLYNCEEYKSNIWEKALSSQDAMPLVENTLATAKVMGTDEVCSDTTRALFNFIDVIGTNDFAFYSMRMIYKMITVIIRDTNTSSLIYKETQKVFNKILTDPAIRELTLLSLLRPLEMVKDEVIRKRALRTLIAITKMVKPPNTEENTNPSNPKETAN